jgi:hypothetical protein
MLLATCSIKNYIISYALNTFLILYILIMKDNDMHYFSNLFDKVLYIFRKCPLSIISSISTLYKRNRYWSC